MKIIVYDFNGSKIRQRAEDGYVNATDMCKVADKRWNNYWRQKGTQEYLIGLAEDLDLLVIANNPVTRIRATALIQVFQGGDSQQGTWVHPEVATDLAQWISVPFRIKVNRWIVQWMTTGKDPVQTQPVEKQVDPEVAAVLAELEKLIISIRSHSRVMHIGSHQPVDELLFKSLHTLNHNQMSAINAAIKQLEMLKRFGSMEMTEDATPITVDFLTLDSTSNVAALPPAQKTQPKSTSSQQQTVKKTRAKKQDKLVAINIKIPLRQRQWLADTARLIRQNSTEPVPPAKRVYPQHLIGIAIGLLQNSSINIATAHRDRQSSDEPLVSINTKISRQQQQWLSDRAQDMRDDNPQPTMPHSRIYPQHLISMAIDLLQDIGINWQQVDSVMGIEQRLVRV